MTSQKLIQGFNHATLLVHSSRSLDELTRHLLQALRVLIPGDACLVNWFGLPTQPVATFYEPAVLIDSEINRLAHLFLHQHPSYGRRYHGTSSISDHVSRREWQRTDMYAQTYRRVGLEDGLGLDFDFGGGCSLTFEIDRRRRGFSAAERQLVDAFRDHVLLAYRRLAPARLPVGAGHVRTSATLHVTADGGIRQQTPDATALLARYFYPLPASRLPEGLAQWFTHTAASLVTPGTLRPPANSYHLSRPGRVLAIHCVPRPENPDFTLILEETLYPPGRAVRNPLSPREREVLHWLAQGKSNSEIATILAIRPGTVKRHLENLYPKLGVENRHAAVLLALQTNLSV